MSKNTNLSFLTDYITADITNGRIGINNASPTVAFDVTGVAKFSTTVTVGGNLTVGNSLSYGYIYGPSNQIFGSIGANTTWLNAGTSGLRINNAADNATLAFVSNAGNVGIGSASITNGTSFGGGGQINKLKVESTNYTCLEINGSTSGGSIQFTYGTNLPNQVGALIAYNYGAGGALNFVLSNVTNGPMSFETSNTERMRITSEGNVGIGTTTPDKKLSVNNGTNNINTAQFYNFTGDQTATTLIVRSAREQSGNPYAHIECFQNVSTLAFRVLANGAVENATGSYGTISDIKFKENVVDATPKLNDILNLKVRNFNLKGEYTKQIGFIAQEFEEVFPAMVDVSKEKDSEETYKSIKTSVLIPVLVKAIQELKAEIETLKQK
jgi:hypothetical protein